MMRRTMFSACACAALCLAGANASAATAFEADVTKSIDLGIKWLADNGAYNNPSNSGLASGLTLLALLEKRPTGQGLDAASQGYSGADATDQERMRKAAAYIIGQTPSQPFYTNYRDGSAAMALSVYLRTGGPDRGQHADLPASLPYTVLGALNAIFDRWVQVGHQSAAGYWCYYTGYAGCPDSSTTQFVVAGMAALRKVYGDVGKPWADATRLASLDAAVAKARQAYVTNGTTSGSTCGNLGSEKGHGYNQGSTVSPQQTASGTWVQIVGGADINDASVQNYLRWLRNRYQYQNISSLSGDYNYSSYWYYLWSSSKALLFLREGGVTPAAGNIGPADFGTLPSGSAPVCSARAVHRDPTADARVALFGAGAAGFYASQPRDFYYDYAYTLLTYQCADGRYACGGAPGNWSESDPYTRQAYALLVLQRSVGGGCVDANKNGICDSEEGGDENAPILLCDANSDGNITTSDLNAVYAIVKSKYPVAVPVNSTNEWANYNTSGASTNTIDINDFWQCYYVGRGMLPKKYATIDD